MNDTSNESLYFPYLVIWMVRQTDQDYFNGLNFNRFFHFYFSNMNISLDIELPFLKLSTFIDNILMQGRVSQIC